MFGRSAKDKEIELLKLQLLNWRDTYMSLQSQLVKKRQELYRLEDKVARIKKHTEAVKDMQPGFSGHNWQQEIKTYQETLSIISKVLRS
jgi:hypothetical protein